MEHIGEIIEREKIVPIETTWRGTRFRSRLEARWAVFLAELGIEWLYEFEGFQLPCGWYVPDFWLPKLGPRHGMWLEIKSEFGADEIATTRCEQLADVTCRDVALAKGPPDFHAGEGIEFFGFHGGAVFWDTPYFFCECMKCGRVGVEFEGRGDRVCGSRCFSPDQRVYGNTPRIQIAIKTAREARFW